MGLHFFLLVSREHTHYLFTPQLNRNDSESNCEEDEFCQM